MRLTCGKCDNGWICEEHSTSRGRMMTAARLQGFTWPLLPMH